MIEVEIFLGSAKESPTPADHIYMSNPRHPRQNYTVTYNNGDIAADFPRSLKSTVTRWASETLGVEDIEYIIALTDTGEVVDFLLFDSEISIGDHIQLGRPEDEAITRDELPVEYVEQEEGF